MKIFKQIILCIALCQSTPIAAQGSDGETKISLEYNGKPLRTVLEDIRSISGWNIIYDDELISGIKVTCSIKESKPAIAITKVVQAYGIDSKLFGKNIIVLFKRTEIEPPSHKSAVVENTTPAFDSMSTFLKPKLISRNNLVYPVKAVAHNIEGKVIIKFHVDKSGDVSESVIEKSSGYGILDTAAVGYTMNMKFSPARVNEQPKDIWMYMTFKFYFE